MPPFDRNAKRARALARASEYRLLNNIDVADADADFISRVIGWLMNNAPRKSGAAQPVSLILLGLKVPRWGAGEKETWLVDLLSADARLVLRDATIALAPAVARPPPTQANSRRADRLKNDAKADAIRARLGYTIARADADYCTRAAAWLEGRVSSTLPLLALAVTREGAGGVRASNGTWMKGVVKLDMRFVIFADGSGAHVGIRLAHAYELAERRYANALLPAPSAATDASDVARACDWLVGPGTEAEYDAMLTRER